LIVGGSQLVRDLVANVLERDDVVIDRVPGVPAADVVVVVIEDRRPDGIPLTFEERPTLVLAPPSAVTGGRALGLDTGCSMVAMDSSPDDLRAAVRLTANGSMVLSPRARVAFIGRRSPPAELTAREVEVLEGLVEGLATKNIARRLELTMKTVEVHKANLFKKLAVRTTAEAVSVAVRSGLVPPRT
jgi:DNA-binding CsgD family transcriptional regulator